MNTRVRRLLLVATALLLGGCGLKGDLYLEEPPPAATDPQPAAAEPADPDADEAEPAVTAP
jgi:predicted small lipoprotein YifL